MSSGWQTEASLSVAKHVKFGLCVCVFVTLSPAISTGIMGHLLLLTELVL
jgi:hypothetical protein